MHATVRLAPPPSGHLATAPHPDANADDLLLSGFVRGPVAQPPGDRASDWWLPGAARLCFVVGGGSVAVEMRRRRFAPLPPVALIGPTDRAHRILVEGASVVSCAITPLGWSRLFHRPAASVRNLVVGLDDLLRPEIGQRLVEHARAAMDGRLTASALHDALCAATRPHRDAAMIVKLAGEIDAARCSQVRDLVETGMSEARLRSLALRHFGSPTKILLRRARFLRSLARVDYAPGRNSYTDIDPSYHDVSHFLRDADYFLGTTPRRFRLLSSQH